MFIKDLYKRIFYTQEVLTVKNKQTNKQKQQQQQQQQKTQKQKQAISTSKYFVYAH